MKKKNLEWIEVRLQSINSKISAIEAALFHTAIGLECFLDDLDENNVPRENDVDAVIYGKEAIEGSVEVLVDIEGDISILSNQIQEGI